MLHYDFGTILRLSLKIDARVIAHKKARRSADDTTAGE
jgi:hypothetical protein